MKVVYTVQSILSLEESLNFLIDQGITVEKVAIIKDELLNRAYKMKG